MTKCSVTLQRGARPGQLYQVSGKSPLAPLGANYQPIYRLGAMFRSPVEWSDVGNRPHMQPPRRASLLSAFLI